MRPLLAFALMLCAAPFAASETLEAAHVRAGARFGEGPNAGLIDGPSVHSGTISGAYRADLTPGSRRQGLHTDGPPSPENQQGGLLSNKPLLYGAGGALAGAVAGFWIGTSVFPGIGSFWGAVMGGLIGGGAGMWLGGDSGKISKAALGAGAGMALGFALGSVFPVIGNFWGMMIGGFLGAAAGYMLG